MNNKVWRTLAVFFLLTLVSGCKYWDKSEPIRNHAIARAYCETYKNERVRGSKVLSFARTGYDVVRPERVAEIKRLVLEKCPQKLQESDTNE